MDPLYILKMILVLSSWSKVMLIKDKLKWGDCLQSPVTSYALISFFIFNYTKYISNEQTARKCNDTCD